MNAIPTDDLRVVKKRVGQTENICGPGFASVAPALAVVAVQRRWRVKNPAATWKVLTTNGTKWIDENGKDAPDLEEWRDLPEVEL